MEPPASLAGAEARALDAARRQTGLSDFGEPSFLEGLGRLLASLDSELPRGPDEQAACLAVVVQTLAARLYAQDGWNKRPEVLSRKLDRPVFIVGAPRTGTTALHKLLAADPAWQGLENWLIATPMPRPPRASWPDLVQYRRAVDAGKARIQAMPEIRSMHYVEPHEVDECLRVTSQTMVSNMFGTLMSAPSYDAWRRNQDFRPSYRRLADNMRLIGANDPDKRWLLKNPSHILDLEELLEVFEDALVIHTHRDPLSSYPSFWSLTSRLQTRFDGPAWRARKNVEREVPLWSPALDRSIDLQRQYPDRILDVYEAEIAAKPLQLAQRIYEFVGQPITVEAEAALRAWVEDNPKGKHGAHKYSLEDFGTTADEILEHVTRYRAHHGFGAEVGVSA